jgi:hypothetical protein
MPVSSPHTYKDSDIHCINQCIPILVHWAIPHSWAVMSLLKECILSNFTGQSMKSYASQLVLPPTINAVPRKHMHSGMLAFLVHRHCINHVGCRTLQTTLDGFPEVTSRFSKEVLLDYIVCLCIEEDNVSLKFGHTSLLCANRASSAHQAFQLVESPAFHNLIQFLPNCPWRWYTSLNKDLGWNSSKDGSA